MQRVLNTSKNYKYQSALPALYTPHSVLPYSYCQDGGGVPVVYGLVKLAGSVLFSGQAVFTSDVVAWQDATDYIIGQYVIGTDGAVYRCYVAHTSSPATKPVTGTWEGKWIKAGAQDKTYMALWLGLCCGNIELIAIYKNSDTLLVDGTDYTSDQFNDGEGAYFPEGIFNTAVLAGIAHILFGGGYDLLANPDERIPDTRFILKRRLPATISHAELYAAAEYLYYGNTWVPYFTYHNWNWYVCDGMIKPFYVIYNKEIRMLKIEVRTWVSGTRYYVGDWTIGTDGSYCRCFLEHVADSYSKPVTGANWTAAWLNLYPDLPKHDSVWADWLSDEPSVSGETWQHKGYEWSLLGENYYPWTLNEVYAVPIDGYKKYDLVIAKDNNVYAAKADHKPEYNNEPAVGSQWQEFWQLVGWLYSDSPLGSYPTGLILVAEDGRAYRCTAENTGTTHLPVSGTDWKDYWALASMPNWKAGKYYHLQEDIWLPGMIKIGSDDQRYVCYLETDNSPENMPITGAYWQSYWLATPTQFPVTSDKIVGGTDGKAYITTNILGVHEAKVENRPISGDDWIDEWDEIFAPDIFLGNNPAAIAYDILTNTFYGLAIPADKIDIASFNVAAVYYNSKDYGLNIKVTDIAEAKKVLNQMLDWCDLVLTVGVNGLIQCKVFDPAAESIGTLSDDDYSSFALTKQSWKDLYNEFEATYSDPARLYEATSIVLKNEAAIEMADGIIKKKTFDLTAFTNRTVCTSRLAEIMRRESYPRNTVSCEVSGAWYFVRPADLIKIIKSEYGINNYFRIVSVSTGKIDELNISLELVDATEVMFDQWDNPAVTEGRRRLISPIGAPFTQGRIT
jgi:hypothetical protein